MCRNNDLIFSDLPFIALLSLQRSGVHRLDMIAALYQDQELAAKLGLITASLYNGMAY